MDFGLEEPLESDDSFFEEPKALTRKSSASKTPEKKSLENLFGLEEKQSRPTVAFEEAPTMQRAKPRDPLEKRTDFLGDLFAPKEPAAKRADSLEDILKDSKRQDAAPSRRADPLEDVLKDTKRQDVARAHKQTDSLFAKDPSVDLGFTTPSSRRRGRRSSGIEDTLGILGGDSFGKEKKEEGPTRGKGGTDAPDWLGASTQPPPAPTKKAEPSQPTPEPLQEHPPKPLDPQQLTMEIQNTYSALNQQESYLLLTLQMKRYEESLQEMKEMQKYMLGKQEKRLGNFLEEYVLKEKVVENNIRLQQERINNQIQMLMSKPTATGTQDNLDEGEGGGDRMLKMLKQRHEEELFILEESYRKQISILETSNRNLEEKLRDELTSTTRLLEEKIDTIKTKYEDELTSYKEKLKMMELQHLDEVKLLKENHSRTLEELKNDHSTQLEYFKQMKQREQDVLGKEKEYSQRIDAGIELLVNNARVLQGIEEKVAGDYDVLASARESAIQTKEKEVIMMRSSLEKCRQAAESERSQLLSLIRSLETKIAEHNHTSQEDRWALQQASATLTARASALEREQEYNRNAIEREREQLKTLKESMLAEQERLIMQLTEEKLSLSSEKARVDVKSKISNTYEVERMRAEAEAAIQAAKELTEKVGQERDRLHRQKSEMDAQRRHLTERERELDEKEVELECLMKDAQRKLREDKRVLIEARAAENAYRERLQELHQQWAAMTSREKKMAEEKVALSKERLALYATTKGSKGCALCKDEPPKAQPPPRLLDLHKNLDVEAFRLRMEVEEERESEVSREDISVHLSRG